MLNYLLSLMASLLAGMIFGFWGGLYYAKAPPQVRSDAIRLSVALALTMTYLAAVLCRQFGITQVDPPWLLGGMVGVVVAYVFPRGFFKISRDGMQVGGNGVEDTKNSDSGSASSDSSR